MPRKSKRKSRRKRKLPAWYRKYKDGNNPDMCGSGTRTGYRCTKVVKSKCSRPVWCGKWVKAQKKCSKKKSSRRKPSPSRARRRKSRRRRASRARGKSRKSRRKNRKRRKSKRNFRSAARRGRWARLGLLGLAAGAALTGGCEYKTRGPAAAAAHPFDGDLSDDELLRAAPVLDELRRAVRERARGRDDEPWWAGVVSEHSNDVVAHATRLAARERKHGGSKGSCAKVVRCPHPLDSKDEFNKAIEKQAMMTGNKKLLRAARCDQLRRKRCLEQPSKYAQAPTTCPRHMRSSCPLGDQKCLSRAAARRRALVGLRAQLERQKKQGRRAQSALQKKRERARS